MRLHFTIALICCLSAKTLQVFAQLPDQGLWALSAERFEVDRLQQIYTIDQQSTLRKYLTNGDQVFMYSNLSLGMLSTIDVSDPFNIILFYHDFQTAVQLDRTLNERGSLFFPELGLAQVDCIAKSRDNQLWIYDGLQTRLLKINVLGTILSESQNLSLLPGWVDNPQRLFACGQYVFLIADDSHIVVFDAFGQYVKTSPLEGKKVVQAWPEGLVLQQADQVWLWNPASPPVLLPCRPSPDHPWKLTTNRIIQLQQNGIHLSSWK